MTDTTALLHALTVAKICVRRDETLHESEADQLCNRLNLIAAHIAGNWTAPSARETTDDAREDEGAAGGPSDPAAGETTEPKPAMTFRHDP